MSDAEMKLGEYIFKLMFVEVGLLMVNCAVEDAVANQESITILVSFGESTKMQYLV